jgi:chromosome partitioning protein
VTRVIAIMNQKGGVGKTTTTANLGAALAARGQAVLLIDSDPQANLTVHLDVDPREIERSLYEVLCDEAPLREAIVPTKTEGLSLLPSHIDLAGAELKLSGAFGRETILKEALRDALEAGPPFDFVLIDCPPSLGLLTVNAMTAATEVLIPLQTEWFAMQGMAKLTEVLGMIRRKLNPALRILGIAPCRVDTRTRLTAEVLDEVREFFGDRVLRTLVRTNIRLAEAPGHGQTIFEYDPLCHGAQDYRALAAEILGDPLPTEASSEEDAIESQSASEERSNPPWPDSRSSDS